MTTRFLHLGVRTKFAHASQARNLLQAILACAFSVFCLTAGTGCSAQSKIDRGLAVARKYFETGEYEKAEIEYKNVLQLKPFQPDAVSQLAIIYFNQGRTGIMFPVLTKANELQPDNLDVRLKLAMFNAAAGKSAEAREQVLFVLDRRPNDPEAPRVLAETALQPKDIEDARQRLKKLSSANSAPVLFALGLLELREGKLKEAEATFLRARSLDPKSSEAGFALGLLYAAQKDLPQAEKAFAGAVAVAPIRSFGRIRYAQFSLQTGRADVAKQSLAEITKKAPDHIPAWLLLASIAATEKKYDECLVAIGKILALDPVHYEALLLRARTRLDKGENDKALDELQRIEKIFPKSPELQYQLGITHIAMGQADKASASLKQALALAPDATGTILMLAELNIRTGKPATAAKSLTELVEKHPENAQARLLLAQAQRSQGNLDEALGVYQKMQTDFQPNTQAPYLAGMILVEQKKLTEARQSFEKALELDPGNLSAVEQLVNMDLFEKKVPDAQKRVNALIAKNPNAGALYLLLAKIHLAKPDTKLAETALRRVVELQPDSPVGYLLLARLYVGSNQKEKALESLQQSVAKNPKNIEALTTIAVIQEEQKNFAGARENYEKILALNPKFVVALNNLAYLYSENFNDVDKAATLAQQARELAPAAPSIADTLGWIRYKQRQYPWARTLLAESAEKMPSSAEVQFHLGMAHYMMGEEKPAQAALERAVSLSTAFPGLAEAKQTLAILAIDPRTGGSKAQAALEKAVADKSDPVALTRLGGIYEQSGAIDKASDAFEAALKANPSSVTAALNVIRMHLLRKETAKAMDLAKATRKLAPDDPHVAHVLGKLAFSTGDYTYALSLLQESARKQPENPDVLFDYAEAAYSQGQISNAQTAMRDAVKANLRSSQTAEANTFLEMLALAANPPQAVAVSAKIDDRLKADPADVPCLMVMGAIQEQKKDLIPAKKTYEKVLAKYPDFSPAKRRLAIIYSKSGASDPKSIEIATHARTAYPDDAEVAKALGILLARQGNHSRAVTLLQESSRELSSDAEVMYYLGFAQHNMKDKAASTRSLHKALELGLKNDLAAEAKKILALSETP